MLTHTCSCWYVLGDRIGTINPAFAGDSQMTLYVNESQTCRVCPAGYTCPTPEAYAPCMESTYSTEGDMYCHVCPAGHACNEPNRTTTTPCLGGSTSQLGQTDCTWCPPGYACPTTVDFPIACLNGQTSAGNTTYCVECAVGQACPQRGMMVPGLDAPLTCLGTCICCFRRRIMYPCCMFQCGIEPPHRTTHWTRAR